MVGRKVHRLTSYQLPMTLDQWDISIAAPVEEVCRLF